MIRAIDKWLLPYLMRRRHPVSADPLHVLLCVCDHFEPFHDASGEEDAYQRVRLWLTEYPRRFSPYTDADGQRPAHTFFLPIEQYDARICHLLEELCASFHTEVEVHLHHRDDTRESLRTKLVQGRDQLRRHGFLAHDADGEVKYGFVHGDWALDDSYPGGGHCGVAEELDVLLETGCYADFTMPSAPNPTQTKTINAIYYAWDTPEPKSHDRGVPLTAGARPGGEKPPLLLVQGPLGLNWRRRKFGVLPRLENGEISGGNPPSIQRLMLWLELAPRPRGRDDIVLIKLHTHGGIPPNMKVLLGDEMERFHADLASFCERSPRHVLHYVTAREAVNILHAVELEQPGNPGDYRDYMLTLK